MTTIIIYIIHLFIIAVIAKMIYDRNKNQPLAKFYFPAMALKMAAGIALGILYKYIYGYGDTLGFDIDTIKIVSHVKEYPSDYLKILFLSKSEYSRFINEYYPRFSGTYLLLKIFSFFYLITNNSYWLTGLYCSLFSFLGMWSLSNVLVKIFPKTEWEATIAFLSFPSILFWSSGMMKESIVEGSIGFVLCFVLAWYKQLIKLKWIHYILGLIFLYWIFKIKFYYFVTLIPVLIIGVFWNKLNSLKWYLKIGFIAGFISVCGYIFPKLNVLLQPHRVTEEIVKNHNINYGFCFERASGGNLDGKGIIMFNHFQNSVSSFITNIPTAWFSSLYRPLPSEAGNLFQLVISLGNLLIFGLSLICIQKLVTTKTQWKPEAIMAIAYASFLGICMAFSSPNMGTLARYKVGYMPFVIYMVLTYSNILKYVTIQELGIVKKLKNWINIKQNH